jgi:NADPH-dependent curcumin reductase
MNIQQLVLQRTPEGVPAESDFRLEDSTLPSIAAGQALVRVHALSLDPYLRSAMAGKHMSGTIAPGQVVRGEGLVEVLASQHPRMQVGQWWVAQCGWRSMAVLDDTTITAARAVAPQVQPRTLALGVLGMPGLTAWAGFHHKAFALAGNTFVVSAASGPVGATIGQLARIVGCRVVGIAGGPQKCEWAVREAGFAACIDYKAEDLRAALQRECPKGVDVYFDNVGGDVLQAVCEQLALNARVVLCGLISQYGKDSPPGPNPGLFIKARATVRGLVVYDHWAEFDAMVAEISGHISASRLRWREDISHGLASTPAAFARLMRGDNQGKSVVVL